jgi:hypothetical protein
LFGQLLTEHQKPRLFCAEAKAARASKIGQSVYPPASL